MEAAMLLQVVRLEERAASAGGVNHRSDGTPALCPQTLAGGVRLHARAIRGEADGIGNG
jgi:hypothetical protein